jgi:hypothetical protein
MARPNLNITIQNSFRQIDKLHQHQVDCERLEARYQHFIGEMIMLRLFSIFEDTVAELAYKIAAGAFYLDGTSPAILIKSGRTRDSRALLMNHGRTRPVDNLKWTKPKFIKESVEHVIPATEPFIRIAQAHGQIIDEMRKVRNSLAHNSPSARTEFKQVVRQIYGFNKSVTPGIYLISIRHHRVCNLTRYIGSTKAILQGMARGS